MVHCHAAAVRFYLVASANILLIDVVTSISGTGEPQQESGCVFSSSLIQRPNVRMSKMPPPVEPLKTVLPSATSGDTVLAKFVQVNATSAVAANRSNTAEEVTRSVEGAPGRHKELSNLASQAVGAEHSRVDGPNGLLQKKANETHHTAATSQVNATSAVAANRSNIADKVTRSVEGAAGQHKKLSHLASQAVVVEHAHLDDQNGLLQKKANETHHAAATSQVNATSAIAANRSSTAEEVTRPVEGAPGQHKELPNLASQAVVVEHARLDVPNGLLQKKANETHHTAATSQVDLATMAARTHRTAHDAAETVEMVTKASQAAAAASAAAETSGANASMLRKAAKAMEAVEQAHRIASQTVKDAHKSMEGLMRMKAHKEVSNAADAVARASNATDIAALESASIKLSSPGVLELRQAEEAMNKAAKDHAFALDKVRAAQRDEERLSMRRRTASLLQSHFENKRARVLAQEAILVRAEAMKAQDEAKQAWTEAARVQDELQRAKGAMEICHWKMPRGCAPVFEYTGVRHTSCVIDEHTEPWCSNDAVYQGSSSKCSFSCEPRDDVSLSENVTAPVLPFDSQVGLLHQPQAGDTASLDETGYTTIASLCDTPEMTRFVRRLITSIGCRITNQFALTGFVPWYSGEADVQSFTKLDGELRCLCTRGQGPPWLEPIDPSNPPTGGLLTCTGRRCNKSR